jgi:CHAD domain-containing protein
VPEIVHGTLPPRASAGEVITHAIADGVCRLLRHDPIVSVDTDPEGVHQARVATRRMRSDLRISARCLTRTGSLGSGPS